MKKGVKYGLGSILILFGLLVGYNVINNWVLFYPSAKFQYSKEYQEFGVYSDTAIDATIIQILDEVSFRLSSTLSFDQGSYKIYLCSKPETFRIFADKVGKPARVQGFNLQPLNHVFINLPFIRTIQRHNNEGYHYNILEGSISHIIAHEISHQLIAEEIGFLQMRNINTWKLEGFCEYAAAKRMKEKDTTYHFSTFAADFFDGKFDTAPAGRKFYITSLLLTEYYLDHQGKTFVDLINEPRSKDELLAEIKHNQSSL